MNFHDSIKPDNTEIISYLFRRLYNIYMKSSQLLLFEADAILRFFWQRSERNPLLILKA